MKIQEQVCAVEQSQKLESLGVKPQSIMYHHFGSGMKWQILPEGFFYEHEEGVEFYPAYSVAELAQMLPDSVEDKQGTPFILEIGKAHYTYSVQYWDRCSSDTKGYLLPRTRDPLLAVCMADMLIVLLENNHITADEVNQRLIQ